MFYWFLVLVLNVGGEASTISGIAYLVNGMPNPETGTCSGLLLESIGNPSGSGYLTFSTVLSPYGTGSYPFYCLQVSWTGAGVTDILQINSRTAWVSGSTSYPAGILLAFPIPIDTNVTFSESQAGVIYPVASGANYQNFTVTGAAVVDSLSAYGISFNVGSSK